MNYAQLFTGLKTAYYAIPRRFSPDGRTLPPLHYYLEVTRRCNLRCRMCQYIHWLKNTSPTDQSEGELTTDEWKSVIDQISRLALISFTGGEPWVRPDFGELLAYAAAKHRVHFISNATLLTEDRAEFCASLAPRRPGGRGLNFVGVSLDGPESLHDEIRGMPGGYRKATEGIGRLMEAKRRLGRACPMLHVTTVIQDANVDVLHEMPAIARSLGADYLNLTMEIRSLDVVVGREMAESDIASDSLPEMVLPRIAPDRLSAALTATREAAGTAGIELRLPRLPESQILKYYDGGQDLDGCDCPPAWMTLIIGRRGDVFPCFSCSVGNVRDESLRKLNNNAKARAFRCALRKKMPELCQGCCELVWRGGAG